MTPEAFPVWITEYCLTHGIIEATATLYPTNEFWIVVLSGKMRAQIVQAGHWHRTRADAVKKANKVLAGAIKSQRDRLEELESIVFEEVQNDERQSD